MKNDWDLHAAGFFFKNIQSREQAERPAGAPQAKTGKGDNDPDLSRRPSFGSALRAAKRFKAGDLPALGKIAALAGLDWLDMAEIVL